MSSRIVYDRATAREWNKIRIEQCKGQLAATARAVNVRVQTVEKVLRRFGMYSPK